MRQLSTQYSLERFWDSMIFTVAATEAWPETAPLGADLSAHLEVGQALGDRTRAIRWTVVRANAKWKQMLRDYQAPALDEGIDQQLNEFMEKRKAALPDSIT